MSHHPTVDLQHWVDTFPIDKLRDERETEFSQYPAWKGKPRSALRRLSCDPISSPVHLAKHEQLREPIVVANQIDEGVPVDIFLWRQSCSSPWLTKLGGTPFRPRDREWPIDRRSGAPYTFIAQFCFLDSFDVLPFRPPGDLLLIFFRNSDAAYGDQDGIYLEWVTINDCDPVAEEKSSTPQFITPHLFGVRYRGFEFPQAPELFDAADCDSSYCLPVSQSTKIGTATFFIQGYPQVPDDYCLIATLNSLELTERWPLVDAEKLPEQTRTRDQPNDWGPYRLMLGDVGCLYVFANKSGSTIWRFDCY